jgi:hypothetical protein
MDSNTLLIVVSGLALGCGVVSLLMLGRMLQTLHERQTALEAHVAALTEDLTMLKVLMKERGN